MLQKIAFILACLLLPVLWGVLVNWLFGMWKNRNSRNDDEPIFPDYQI